ncbi:MAG: hypothetical protein WBV89_19350, partial [Ilumatobacter sp.]
MATVVPALAATVTVTDSDRLRIDARASSLVQATLTVLHRHVDADVSTVAIDVDTTIPRSVGLAGSSAIVIATIRALVLHHR